MIRIQSVFQPLTVRPSLTPKFGQETFPEIIDILESQKTVY